MTKTRPKLSVITKAMLSKAKRLDSELPRDSRRFPITQCPVCKTLFAEDDTIVTKKSGSWTKWYHSLCAKQVNIIAVKTR